MIFTVALHAAVLALWAYHLRRVGKKIWLALACAALMGAALAASPSGHPDAEALGEAFFMYLLLSVFSAYDRQAGLQSLASGALLISAGVLTKPPVAISCLLVSLAFFAIHRRRTASGAFGFALLMFTPAMLCIVSAAVLALLTGQSLGAVPSSLPAAGAPAALPSMAGSWWLAVPLSIGTWRLFCKRISASDIAFGFMLLAVTALSFIPHMPQPLHRVDVFYLAWGGSAALFTQTIRRRA